jgi:hypothetical protein
MKPTAIPGDVKQNVEEIVERFNRENFRAADCYYLTRYKGKYLYLDRSDYGKVEPICRLTYKGKMDAWEFAIFKWSSERYDQEEWMFPGNDFVNGTIEGAMQAGLEAYPA